METHAVTGALSYSGKYIAHKLIKNNLKVITLTNSPHKPNPFGDKIKVLPLSFNNEELLIKNLQQVDVLYNTYWVRFDHKRFTHSTAVDNTLKLFKAAKKAGVKRIVHFSITNPDENSHLPYFKGKAVLEKALINSGISYSILRPTVLFGKEDILINNICWMIRKFPFFGVFGKGDYKLQPIFIEDMAELAVNEGSKSENNIINAIGMETFTYRELVKALMNSIDIQKPIIGINPRLAFFIGKIFNWFVNDIVITKEEIDGLTNNLLYVTTEGVGDTLLTQWAKENKYILGKKYANELKKRK